MALVTKNVFPKNFEDVEAFGYSKEEVLAWLNLLCLKKVEAVTSKNGILFLEIGGDSLPLTLQNFFAIISREAAFAFSSKARQFKLTELLEAKPKFFVEYLALEFAPAEKRNELIELHVDLGEHDAFRRPFSSGRKTLFIERRYLHVLEVRKENKSLTLEGEFYDLCCTSHKILDENGKALKERSRKIKLI